MDALPMSAIAIEEDLVALPAENGWLYKRSWHCVGHPQSGIELKVQVGAFAQLSEDDAALEVDRLYIPYLIDRQLFELWQVTGGAH
jgi:hypothetical protein